MRSRALTETEIRKGFAGRTVLLTGVTGFLGGGVLEKILRSLPEVGRILVLVRGNPKYSGEMRLRRRMMGADVFSRLRDSMGMELATLAESKIAVLEGDLSLPGLGLSEADQAQLGSVDIVIHAAASVVFDAPLDRALRTNLEGPRTLIRLLREAGARPRLVHISTAYVCGARRGLVPEVLPGELPEGPSINWRTEVEQLHRTCDAVELISREPGRLNEFRAQAQTALGPAGGPAVAEEAERRRTDWVRRELISSGISRARALGWNDVYNFTKALAERAVHEEAGDLELAIVRPTIIESAWREPEPGWLDGFKVAEPVILGYARGEIPDFPGRVEGVLDMIPVDCVINAALAAAVTPLPERRRVFQVSTGNRKPLRYGTLFSIVRDFFMANPLTGADGFPIRVPDWQFRGRERLESRLRMAGRAARVGRSVARLVPSFAPGGRRLKHGVSQLDKVVGQAQYYQDLYGDYVEMETVFEDRNTHALFMSLGAEERLEFNFDVSQLDWTAYLAGAHLPTVVRMVEGARERKRAIVAPTIIPAPAGAGDPPAAAFFDVDGTLLETTVVHYYLWLELRQRGLAEWPAFLAQVAPDALRWRKLDKQSRAAFNREFYRVYRGLDADRVRELAAETLDELSLPRLYPKAVQAIRAHRRNGTRIVFLTGALDFLVAQIAPLADEIISARLAEHEGHFTGALEETPIAGEARSAHLRRWAEERGIDPADCWAYADSVSDLPMLAAVGHAVAVNPDDSLRREARTRKWAVAEWDLPYPVGMKLPVAT